MKNRLFVAVVFLLLFNNLGFTYVLQKGDNTILVQPNGYQIPVVWNETFQCYRDLNGYLIVGSTSSAYYVYGIVRMGIITGSGYIVGDYDPTKYELPNRDYDILQQLSFTSYSRRDIELNTAFFSEQKAMLASASPKKGTVKPLIIYLSFKQVEMIVTKTKDENGVIIKSYQEVTKPALPAFNDQDKVFFGKVFPTTFQPNSLPSYFNEVSRGALTIAPHEILTYHDNEHPQQYYQMVTCSDEDRDECYHYATVDEAEHKRRLQSLFDKISEKYNALQLDLDQEPSDGILDNVIFIIDDYPGTHTFFKTGLQTILQVPLGNSSELKLFTKKVNQYVCLNRCRGDQSNTELLLLNACHEYFHTLGGPDMGMHGETFKENYYNPMVHWDVMGGNKKITHMLSYMKWKYGGWLREQNAIQEITPSNVDKNGYTLQRSSSPNGTVAYKIISPHSKNPKQYFMLEYRHKSGEFEVNIPDNGIIVYGVNEDKRGNHSIGKIPVTYKDSEAYIFRPGVSIIYTSGEEVDKYKEPSTKGQIENAILGENGITGITSKINLENGNPDPRVDPQLRLFDGTPAGFRIYDVATNGNTATFKIEFEKTCSEFRIERESPERVKEDVGEVKIKIKRSDFLSTTARIRVFTKDISAEAGKDYTSFSEEIVFEAEDKEKPITIPIILDTLDEEDESFEILLEKIDDTGIPSSESGSAKFVIIGTSITTGMDLKFQYLNHSVVKTFPEEYEWWNSEKYSYPVSWRKSHESKISGLPLDKEEEQILSTKIDLNNDGLYEVVTYVYNKETSEYLRYIFKITGNTNPQSPVYTKKAIKKNISYPPFMLAIGDMNNDGYNDIVAYYGYDSVEVMYGNGYYNLSSPIVISPTSYLYGNCENPFIKLVDYNGDGFLDILTDSFGIVNSNGSYHSVHIPETGFNWDAWIADWFDIDNDGDYDAIISGFRHEANHMIPGFEDFGEMYQGAVFNQTRLGLNSNGNLSIVTSSDAFDTLTIYEVIEKREIANNSILMKMRTQYTNRPYPVILYSHGEGNDQFPDNIPDGFVEMQYSVSLPNRNSRPEAPKNLRYTIQGNSIFLQWDSAEDFNSPGGKGVQYHIAISGNQGVYDDYNGVKHSKPNTGCSLKKPIPTTAVASITGSNNGYFTFTVYAIDPNGLVSPSSVPCEVVLNPQQKTTPGQNQASVMTSPNMEWPADNAAVTYNLRISTSPMSIPVVLQSSRSLRSEGVSPVVYENISTNTINVNDLAHNAVYYWQYQSVYADSVGEWSEELSFTTSYPSLTNVQVDFTKTSSSISWNYSSANPTGVRIQRHVLGINEWETVFTSNEPITHWQDTAFYENCYEYRVQEYSEVNASEWVQFVCDNSPLLNPSNVTIVPENGAYIVSWESGSEKATGYAVYLQQEDGSWVELYRGGTDVVSYRYETDLLTANFKVCSVNSIKESGGVVRFIDMRDLPKVRHLAVALQGTIIQLRWFVDFGGFYEYELEKSVNDSAYVPLITVPYDTVSAEDPVTEPGVYRYRIRVKNTWKQSEWLEAVYDNRFLSAPENLIATLHTNSVVLAWQSSNSEQTVTEIERKVGEEAFVLIATLEQGIKSFTDTALSEVLLTYRVREKVDTLVSPWSQEVIVDNRVLTKPKIVDLVKSDNSRSVTWEQLEEHATSLVVQRKIDGGFFTTIAEISAEETHFTDETVISGRIISYRIQSKNIFRSSEWSDEAVIDMQPLQRTEIASLSYHKTDNRVALTWVDNNTVETGYEIWRAQRGDDAVFVKIATVPIDSTVYYDNHPEYYTSTSYTLRTMIGEFIISISEFEYRYKIRAVASAAQSDFSMNKMVRGCRIQIRYNYQNRTTTYSSITSSDLKKLVQDARISVNGVMMSFAEFEQLLFHPKAESFTIGISYLEEDSEKTALWYLSLPYNRAVSFGSYTMTAKTSFTKPVLVTKAFELRMPDLPVHIEPFFVSFEENSSSLVHLKNSLGETGILFTYENEQWKIVDYSRDVLSIKKSGIYVVCRDSNFKYIPRIMQSSLKQNFPNPFNPITTIFYDVAESGKVVVSVFNAKGKSVCTLVDMWMNRGAYSVIWNGLDSNGRPLPSGVYYYCLEINGKRYTKKMVMLK